MGAKAWARYAPGVSESAGKKKGKNSTGGGTWHLLSDPEARYPDPGPDYYTRRIDPDRRRREQVRQLEDLGCIIYLELAAWTSSAKPSPAPPALPRTP